MATSAVTDIYTVVLEVDARSGAAVLKQTEAAMGNTAGAAEKLVQRVKDLTATMEGSSAADRTKLRTIEGVDGAITRLITKTMTPYERSLRDVERAEQLAAQARKLGSAQADAAAAAVERLRMRTDALSGAANDNAETMRKASTTIAGMEGAAASLTGRLGALGTALSGLGPLGIALGATLAAAGAAAGLMVSAGEKINALDGKLRIATGSAQGAAVAFDAIYASARQIGLPIEAGIDLFGRMTLAAKDLGATRSEVLKLTDTIQKFAVAGGSSAQEAASGAQQLGQALASGVLQGDELRSILENMPLLARALADGLNTSVGRLRDMGAAGELTSQRVFQAIVSQSAQADKMFGQLGDSVERAQARMGNAWDVLLARLNKIFGASEALARVYNNLAKGMEAITPTADTDRLGRLLQERDNLLSRQANRRGDLAGIPEDIAKYQPTFSNADTVRGEVEERKRLKQLNEEIFALEMQREADLRGIQAEAAQARQDAFKRQFDAMQLIGRSLDELVGQYRLEAEQLNLSDYALRKIAATEKGRLDYLKENGITTPAALAALQITDPGRAVALTAGAEQAGAEAGKLSDAQRRKDLDDYNRSLAEEMRLLAAAPAARYKVQAAIEAEALVRKGLISSAEQAGYQSQIEAKLLGQAADAANQQSLATRDAIKGNLDLVAAWAQGAGAAEVAAARMQAHAQAAGKAGMNEARLAVEIRNSNAAAAAADLAKRNADLAEQNAYLAKLVDAEKHGAEAIAEVELVERKRLATREARAKLDAATDPKVRDALEQEIKATEKLIDSNARLQASRQAAAMQRQQQQDLSVALAEREIAIEVDPTRRAAMEQALALKQAELQIRQQLVGASEEEIQNSLRLAEAIIRTQAETRRVQEIQAKGRELFDDLANMVQQAGEKGGKGFAESLVTWTRAALKTLAKEMVLRPIIQPIMTQFVGALPQLFGISSGGSTAAAAGGLGSVLSPISDILGMAKNFVGDTFSGVSSWINGIGSSLGFASTYATPMAASAALGVAGIPGGVSGTMMGTATNVGGVFGSTTLSGLLGGVGAGFGVGSLLNGLLGGSQVGGMIGSGVGSLGGALAGTFLFPGVGTLLGGILGGGAGGVIGGLFGKDKQTPRGYAGGEIGSNNRFSASGVHQAGLDGYDNSADRQQMAQFAQTMNATMDRYRLNFSTGRDAINANGATNGLLTIGTMYGGAKDAADLFMRWFTTPKGKAAGAGTTTEADWMRASGYTRNSTYDRDTGWTSDLRDAAGNQVTQEAWNSDYEKWRSTQTTGGATGSLFKSDDAYVQKALDRMANGDAKVTGAEDVQKFLDLAGGFKDAADRAAAGLNTLKRQTLEWDIAARDAGRALAQQVKDYLDAARSLYGEGSTEINQAATAQRQNIYALMNLDPAGNAIDPNAPSDMLTGRNADLAQAKAQIAQYKDALIATGLTAEQAATVVERGMAATSAAINARWDEIDRRSNAALNQRQGNAAIIAYGAKSGYTADQLAIDAQAEQQRQELYDAKAAGKSPAEIARMETAQATERAALAEQQLEQARRATESMTDRQNAALVTLGRASEADAQRSSMQARHRQELWDAEHQGRDKDSIKMLLHTQQLEDEALAYQQAVQAAQQAAQAAGAFNASLTSVAVARAQSPFAAAEKALDKAKENLADAQNGVSEIINKMVSGWTQAADSLKSARDQIMVGDLSPRDLAQRMEVARGLYETSKANALTDPEEAQKLGQLGQQYLQAAKAYFGPNVEYARIFDEVTGTLASTETAAQQQARIAQNQLDKLREISGKATSIDEAMAKLVAAQAAKDAAETGKTTAEAGMNTGLLGQFNTLAGQYSAYMATETPNVGAKLASENAEAAFGGARDAILNAITDWKILNQIGERYYNHVVGGVADVIRVKVLQLGGTPSFETGGYHWGGLRLVGERGPELEVTGPARYWSAAETRALLAPNAGGLDYAGMPSWATSDVRSVIAGGGRFDLPAMPRTAANDREATAELIAELKALRKEVAELKGAAEAGNRIAVGAAEANIEGLAVTAREQRQTATAVKRASVYR
ncbi:MAG: tape measure protein [Alphaproteobacteria bacterium]|jgi:tape measure domain-containing protein|nr:tape measure protein [Alphaproteobacteria bacterium]